MSSTGDLIQISLNVLFVTLPVHRSPGTPVITSITIWQYWHSPSDSISTSPPPIFISTLYPPVPECTLFNRSSRLITRKHICERKLQSFNWATQG